MLLNIKTPKSRYFPILSGLKVRIFLYVCKNIDPF